MVNLTALSEREREIYKVCKLFFNSRGVSRMTNIFIMAFVDEYLESDFSKEDIIEILENQLPNQIRDNVNTLKNIWEV